jgi:adenylate cyclase
MRVRGNAEPVASRGVTGPATRRSPRRRWLSLRFVDADLERSFQRQYFRDNVSYIRAAHVLVIGAWSFFSLLAIPDVGYGSYVLIHALAVVATSISLALTFTRGFWKWSQSSIVGLVLVSCALSETHRLVTRHPAEWDGVIAVLLILAVTFSLLRLQCRYAALAGFLAIVGYNVTHVLVQVVGDIGLFYPDVYLAAFAVVGTAAALALERFARLLFLRERDLDRERERGDRLLRNTLPEAIIERLKMREPGVDGGRIAETCPDVTVLFADLVGFTEQAAHTEAEDLLATLDDVFARWDVLADRFRLEKIKTIGDAYLAVAGVPRPRTDHVEAAATVALEMRDGLSGARWPAGTPISVRIGMACGPVIAGVIGHRKFAYDVWGDTVNTASRLESSAAAGSIQVSDVVYERLRGRFVLSSASVVDLKGKGPTRTHSLLGRKPAGDGIASRRVRQQAEGERLLDGRTGIVSWIAQGAKNE